MTPARRRDLALTYGPAALVAAAVIALQLVRFGGLYAASDDSYIYLGYVKRALEPPRQLFSYNPGEHSAGTTGVLYYYALIVAAAGLRCVTFFLPIATTLTLAMYLLNSLLFVGCAGLLARLVRRLTDGSELWVMFAFVLLLWNVKFTWGMFAGLENPLTAFLAVALVSAIARGAPIALSAILAALLVGTRPELGPTLALVPGFAAVCASLPLRTTARWLTTTAARALAATALWGAVLATLASPCWLTTGRFFPSALSTRVSIPAIADPQALWRALAGFQAGLPWRNEWALGNLALLIALLVVSPYRNLRVPLAATAFVTLQFGFRGLFGLYDLNVQDRYVSYLWPLYVLAILPLVQAIVAASPTLSAALARPAVARAVGVGLAAYAALGLLGDFDERFSADVREMNQVVVTPARWMRDHLPPGSRLAMEPAGAVRVFTNFYLVDALGLTTEHSLGHPSFADFMLANRVDYAFDYPKRVAELADPSRYERVMSWRAEPRRRSLGEIGLYRLRDR